MTFACVTFLCTFYCISVVWTEPGAGCDYAVDLVANVLAAEFSNKLKLRFLYGLRYRGLYFYGLRTL